MEVFFLNYVNETMYLLWNLPFFTMVPPKTNFFSFLKPWAENGLNKPVFMSIVLWCTSCHPISKTHTVGEGPGETLSALRCLSYLINSFLTDIKQLAKTSKGGTLHPPSDVCVRSFLCPLSTLIQLCYTKALEWPSLVPGPKAKSSSGITNPTPFTISYHVHQ